MENTGSLEEYLEKWQGIPNDVNRSLRLIRQLDKRIEALQVDIQQSQKVFMAKFKDQKDKKPSDISPELTAEYQSLRDKLHKLYGFGKEKMLVAEQLRSSVSTCFDALDN